MAQHVRNLVSRKLSSSPLFFTPPPIPSKKLNNERLSGSASLIRNRILHEHHSPTRAPCARLFTGPSSTNEIVFPLQRLTDSELLKTSNVSNTPKFQSTKTTVCSYQSPLEVFEKENAVQLSTRIVHNDETPKQTEQLISTGNIPLRLSSRENALHLNNNENKISLRKKYSPGKHACCEGIEAVSPVVLVQDYAPKKINNEESLNKPFNISRITLTPTRFHRKNISCNNNDNHINSEDLNKGGVYLNTPFREELVKKGLDGLDFKPCVLGRGGFGVVVLAVYGGKQVAVKIITKNNRRRQSIDISIQNERHAVDLLHHPNVVQTFGIYDVGKNFAIIVMEYAGSVHLMKILENPMEVITFKRRIGFALQIANALDWCHKHQLLHLDVKPANVMVSDNDLCKLGDFGCSRNLNEVDDDEIYLLGGTIAYRAPELLQGQIPSLKADIYSFGITMWQILTREVPYNGLDQHVIVYKVVSCDARPCSPHTDDLGTLTYIKLYEKLWNRDANKRLPSDLICNELEELNGRFEM